MFATLLRGSHKAPTRLPKGCTQLHTSWQQLCTTSLPVYIDCWGRPSQQSWPRWWWHWPGPCSHWSLPSWQCSPHQLTFYSNRLSWAVEYIWNRGNNYTKNCTTVHLSCRTLRTLYISTSGCCSVCSCPFKWSVINDLYGMSWIISDIFLRPGSFSK